MQEFLTIFTFPIEGETSTIKNESYEKITIKKHKNSLSKILCYISTGFFYLRQLQQHVVMLPRYEGTVCRCGGSKAHAGGLIRMAQITNL